MTDPKEWIKKIMTPDEVAQIESKAKKIIKSDRTVYEMSILMTQADMIEAVKASMGMQHGDQDSWMIGVNILMAFFDTMIEALEADGINPFE